jgi:iron complex transport system ATP-binding protein
MSATVASAGYRASPLGAPLLETSNVRIVVADRVLVDALTLTVAPGQCWAIVGRNGAGKTSLLRVLAGLALPASGVVRYAGRPIDDLDARERARHRSLLPQDSHDAFPASALQTVLVGRHPHLSRFAWETGTDVVVARDALRTFGIAHLESRDVRTLSGGERRRVALAALLAQDAPLALLDEPSSHLDIAQQSSALAVFLALARQRGRAVVMVLHDLHLATRFCDRAIAIGDGHATTGSATDILEARRLSALFGCPLVELSGDGFRTFVPR